MAQGLLSFEQAYNQTEISGALSNLKRVPPDSQIPARALDAYRIKISHLYDKLSSLSNSRTRLLPHQIEATYTVVNAIRPRFILADEVGLGKTIEAGLVMKELMLRKGYSRVLVCAPATLTVQWRNELLSKFNEDFTILNRHNFPEISSQWKKFPRILTSIDFVKNPDYYEKVLKAGWDIVIFDEAHRLRRDDSKITHAYAFAEKISARCEALLLLTATPFRGKLEELFYLVRLIDSHLLGPRESFYIEYVLPSRSGGSVTDLRPKLEKVLLRRTKKDVGGFTRRHARTIRFELTPPERAFYDATTEYVRREYNLAMAEKNRAVGFVMIAFQKLLDSSSRALIRALEKRKAMLELRMHRLPVAALRQATEDSAGLLDSIDDFDDADNFDFASDDEGSFEKSFKELRKEAMTLGHLIKLGNAVKTDRKLQKLRDTLVRLKKEGQKKFLIFTQFRTTQDYLAENLTDFKVVLFHGSLNVQQKEDAVESFKNETEVLICTEAGGEGRNLQFANILINYDLPWSPLKIEQRIGRLHRFGQKKDVYIFNFATRDTVAERIIEVLENKIRLFEESIGPSDSLLGSIEEDSNFHSVLMDVVSGRISASDFEENLEDRIRSARSSFERLGELVTPRCVDFNLDDYYRSTQKTRPLENLQIENLVKHYTGSDAAGRYTLSDEVDIDDDVHYYKLKNHLTNTVRSATFNSELALSNEKFEFLAVGHPVVDEALSFYLENTASRSIQRLPARKEPGFYFVFACKMGDSNGRIELCACYTDRTLRSFVDDGAALNDYAYTGKQPAGILPAPGISLDEAFESAREAVTQYCNDLATEWENQLNPAFKNEQYKIEISYGKRLRSLEEKRDIQKLQYRMNPVSERKGQLTRMENQIIQARQEMQLQLEKLRRESKITIQLELLQVYELSDSAGTV